MTTPTSATPSPRTLRKVVAAGFIGTTVEYYDFFIYGTAAALVFPKIFFPALGDSAAVMASFATFGVAFLARPLGGIVFGHIGDRVGRKTTLVITMMLMGVATVMIGLLPDGNTIGIWAPMALITLRFAQGLAVGGEWASAALFVGEYAPKDKRALFALAPTLGTSTGLLLSTVTFLITGFTMSTETFEAWGWRVPFLLSVVLVAVGMYVRLGISETPVFKEAAAKAAAKKATKTPLAQLFQHQTKEVLLAAGATIMWLSFFYIGAVYLTNYGTAVLGFSRNEMLTVNLIGVMFNIGGSILGAVLADRFGRRITIGAANLAAVGWAFAMFPLANSGNIVLMGVAVSVSLVIVGVACGTTTALLPEIFATRYRSTGTGVSFNLGSVLGGAIPPIVAAPIFAATGSMGLTAMMAILAAISVVCVVFLRETKGLSLGEDSGDGSEKEVQAKVAVDSGPSLTQH
ncbi:MFS transporter [Citricoccus zhacaiensis]|uniref:MFS transporter n=1 Tax=Citricoccus zhacaiensis TaxID=489142 RepID=A0ABQ2MA32_9MICC|nr:MFS transporter [Citricoccus zhacaiensis]GGO48681.1 MFS transporter [Citricoccus zhacaiensis]